MPTNTPITIPIANGVVSVPMAQGSKGQVEVQLFGPAPTAGTLKIEGLQWTGTYQVLQARRRSTLRRHWRAAA